MSTFAFGTYRVTDLNPLHIEAIKDAVEGGIELIDTSTNYMDGGAERAIAKALDTIEDGVRDKVKIVSKFGYIQGTTLAKHKQEPFEDVIEHSEICFYSIAKTFLHEQLTQSLQRLNRLQIDCYLIHNPEYIILDGLKKELSREDSLELLYRRLYEAFTGLEEEVLNGRIKSYGISSNSFAKKMDDPEFLPFEDLLTLAQDAAKEVGNANHSFSTIELPYNLLERDGDMAIAWAKANGLRVITNRALNAQKDGLMYRLADYEEPKEYYHALNELLEIAQTPELQALYNLIEQLDTNKHKYGWVGDYDTFLYAQIIPHIKKTIENIHEDLLETLLQYIDNFLQNYRAMVAYECSKLTRTALKEELKMCHDTMQSCALKFLLQKEEIDFVAVGMRKPSYVQEILALMG
jgi:aryl-alcohol dehydrogenase-like predicted oxidoreductase